LHHGWEKRPGEGLSAGGSRRDVDVEVVEVIVVISWGSTPSFFSAEGNSR
jgi:hypothetical protein